MTGTSDLIREQGEFNAQEFMDTPMEMAYIGRCGCGCGAVPFATIDRPEWAKDTAKSIAEAIRDGYTIERVPLSEVRMSTCKRQLDLLTTSCV